MSYRDDGFQAYVERQQAGELARQDSQRQAIAAQQRQQELQRQAVIEQIRKQQAAQQAAIQAEQERQAKIVAEREAAVRAEQERQAKIAAEREAAARAEQERQAKITAARDTLSKQGNDIYGRLSKFDSSLTRESFDKFAAESPQAILDVYEQYKPKKFVGSKIKLNDGREATVSGIRNYQNNDGFYVDTDLGELNTFGKNFIEKGAIYNKDKTSVLSIQDAQLDELEQGDVGFLQSLLYDDLPTLNNSGLGLSSDFYLFNDLAASPNLNVDWTDPNTINDRYENVYVGGLNLAKGDNGKLYYAGQNVAGNSATVGFLHGDRAAINRPFTGTAAGGGFSGSSQDVTQGKSLLGKAFGGFGESVAGAVRGALSNPIVQLGLAVVNPAAAAGAQFGSAVGSGAPIGDALKNAAKSYAIGQVAGQVGSAVGAPTSSAIANQAAQSAAGGAVGGLLSGQDPLKSGLLAGAAGGISAGIQSGANAVKNAVSPNRGDISTGLSPADSFGAGPARQPGINMDRFNPSTGLATDGLSAGTGGVGLRTPSLPVGGGIGISVPIRNAQGQVTGFQTSRDFIKPNFTNAIGDPSSIYNSPELLGRDVVSADGVRKFGAPNAPVTSELSDRAADRLIGGLLGGGAIAAGAGLLSNRGGSGGQMPQQVARPLDQFQINPQVNQYTGDFNTFGERGSQGFRFYNAPVTGLLG
jgi:hypothetical protein